MNIPSFLITAFFGLVFPAYISYRGWGFTGSDRSAQGWVLVAITAYCCWLLMASLWLRSKERQILSQDPKNVSLAWKEFQGHLVEIDSKTYRMESAGSVYYPGSPLLPHNALENFLPLGQPVLVTLGLLGTFFGLALGLSESVPNLQTLDTVKMQEGMNQLLGGAQTAFSKSFTGIGLALCWMIFWRDIERQWHKDIHTLAEQLDREYPFISAQRRMMDTLIEIRVGLSSTPQQEFSRIADVLTTSFSKMLSSQQALTQTLTKSFQDFDSQTIGQTVVDGIGDSLNKLTKAQEETNQHTRQLLDRQTKTDEAVTRQLKELVTSLQKEALEPLGKQIQDVAQHVSTVAKQLETSTNSVNTLAVGLGTFQTESLGRLEGFSKNLNDSVSVLSEKVVGEIRSTLGKQTETLQQVGKQSSDLILEAGLKAKETMNQAQESITKAGNSASNAITKAGEEATETLKTVRTTFADTLIEQKTALNNVLTDLQEAYKNEIALRKDYSEKTAAAIKAVNTLEIHIQTVDKSIRNISTEALRSMTDAITQANSANEALKRILQHYLAGSKDQQDEFTKRVAIITQHISEIQANQIKQQQALSKS